MSSQRSDLRNVYNSIRSEGGVLFLDESFSAPQQGRLSFYIVSGALLNVQDLDATRADLLDIVGKDYWHTTEALQHRSTGIPVVKDLLEYCANNADPMFISYVVPCDADVEQSRQLCLAGLLAHEAVKGDVDAVVVEARRYKRDDDKDRALVRRLRTSGDLGQAIPVRHVSPSEEWLLWLPDLVAMMYRRRITHQDETARFFDTYLRSCTTMVDLAGFELRNEVQRGQSLVSKIMSATAAAPADNSTGVVDLSCHQRDDLLSEVEETDLEQ